MIRILILLLVSFSVACKTDTKHKEYADNLQEMLMESGTEEAFRSVLDKMILTIETRTDSLSTPEIEAFIIKLKNEAYPALFEKLVPVYKKHFTSHELKEVSEFYKTGQGQNHAQKINNIEPEVMEVSKKWGFEIGQEFKSIMGTEN